MSRWIPDDELQDLFGKDRRKPPEERLQAVCAIYRRALVKIARLHDREATEDAETARRALRAAKDLLL